MTRAGYRAKTIFAMWSTVVVVGISPPPQARPSSAAPIAGGNFRPSGGRRRRARARVDAMIPEAIYGGGSLTVLPIVAGFLFALYLALSASIG